jgi:hypothetical protein
MVRGLCGRSRSGRRGDCLLSMDHADGVCWRADRAWGSGSRGRGGGGGDFGRPAPCSPWTADRGDGLPWSPRSMGVGVAWPEPRAVHWLSR